jgi:hypothetical protein
MRVCSLHHLHCRCCTRLHYRCCTQLISTVVCGCRLRCCADAKRAKRAAKAAADAAAAAADGDGEDGAGSDFDFDDANVADGLVGSEVWLGTAHLFSTRLFSAHLFSVGVCCVYFLVLRFGASHSLQAVRERQKRHVAEWLREC